MQRVLVISEPGGVSEFYRTLTPYRLLASAGLIELSIDEGHNPAIIDHLDKFDTVVFSRADSAEHSLILLHAKLRGLRVCREVSVEELGDEARQRFASHYYGDSLRPQTFYLSGYLDGAKSMVKP